MNKLLGLLRLGFDTKTNSFVTHKVLLMYSRAFMLLVIIGYPYSVYILLNLSNIYPSDGAVVKWTVISDYLHNYIILLVIYYHYNVKHNKILQIMKNCIRILKSLQQYELIIEYELQVLTINLIIPFVVFIWSIYPWWQTFVNYKLITFMIFLPERIIQCTIINYCFAFVLIKTMLKSLNLVVVSKIQSLQASTKNNLQDQLKLCDQLDDILSIYARIAEICDQINGIFLVQLLFIIGYFFVMFVVQVSYK
jgi:hypothetical protein